MSTAHSPHSSMIAVSTGRMLAVVGAKPGVTVQVVPGKSYVPLPEDACEPVAIADLMPIGGGTYRLVARICPRWFGCTAKNLKLLGIGISTNSMIRLIKAGFVVGQQTISVFYQFDYYSYRAHERRVAEDPEFWTRVEPGQTLSNRARIKEVSDGRSLTE